jgi:hypothetical protein
MRKIVKAEGMEKDSMWHSPLNDSYTRPPHHIPGFPLNGYHRPILRYSSSATGLAPLEEKCDADAIVAAALMVQHALETHRQDRSCYCEKIGHNKD